MKGTVVKGIGGFYFVYDGADVVMGKQTRPLEVALSFTSASLLKVYKGEVSKLTLPELQ